MQMKDDNVGNHLTEGLCGGTQKSTATVTVKGKRNFRGQELGASPRGTANCRATHVKLPPSPLE